MANSVITKLNPTGFNGEFNYQDAVGTFNTTGEKVLQSINGSKEGYGSFDANRWGGPESQWSYNPHFSDITKAAELISLMTGSIEAVEAELSQE
jgi:hypothetical protein